MKYLILCLLLLSPAAHAGWFSKDPDPTLEYKVKVTSLENRLSAQSSSSGLWQIAAGSLGIGCVLFFVIGTALGAQTRQHHHATTRRMGSTPPPPNLNGRKPTILGEAAEEETHTTLAA